MGHGLHEQTTAPTVLPRDKSKILSIWRTALYLAVITTVEFILAFTVTRGVFLTIIFVALTLVKAFYIVAEFMHLKYEVKVLIWSIILPILFIVWLIVALLAEGSAIFDLRETWGWF